MRDFGLVFVQPSLQRLSVAILYMSYCSLHVHHKQRDETEDHSNRVSSADGVGSLPARLERRLCRCSAIVVYNCRPATVEPMCGRVGEHRQCVGDREQTASIRKDPAHLFR